MSPMEWSEALYTCAGPPRLAVCTDHKGKHEWVIVGPLGPDDGFCMGLFRERMLERCAELAAGEEATP